MTPVRVVRRYPLLSYVLLACLFGWSPYIVTFLAGGSGAENLPLGPLAATLIVVSCQGRQELRSWGRRLRTWRAAPGWYLLAVLVPVGLQVLVVVMNHGLGAPLPTSGQLADWAQVPLGFLGMLILVGIGEEAGWALFAAPILLRRHGILVAWVLASAMRIFWHLPLMIGGDLSWLLGTVGNAAFCMVMLLLLLASEGRWTLVAVWHAALNAMSGLFFFTMVSGADRERLEVLFTGGYSIVAVAAYLAWSRHLTLRDGRTASGAGALPES
jgi:membrane protease YdiL (CAAX protease family)